MIHVTRLNHSEVVLNGDLIEQIEMTPDTVITLTTGQKIMVLESTEEIVQRVVEFRRSILTPGYLKDHAPEPVVCSTLGAQDDSNGRC